MILSVVIPTMNKADLLRRTLEAVRGQQIGGGEPWEVVVVDDGSTDHTAQVLAAQTGWERPSLVVVRPPANVGRARARNLGARQAVGRWLVFLDDDIVAPPGLLQAHLDVLQEDPTYGTIGFAVTAPEVSDAPHFHYLDTRGVARLGSGPAPARFFVTQNAAVPREAFLAVGGFDEGFSAYGFEDMEVAFRLEEQGGVRFRALPAPVPVHVHHHTLRQYLDKKIECGRHSLALLAGLHPQRLPEMRLHHVVDAPGAARPGWRTRGLRALLDSPVGRGLPRFVDRWPAAPDGRPRWPWLYCRVMNLTVLACFRAGLSETRV